MWLTFSCGGRRLLVLGIRVCLCKAILFSLLSCDPAVSLGILQSPTTSVPVCMCVCVCVCRKRKGDWLRHRFILRNWLTQLWSRPRRSWCYSPGLEGCLGAEFLPSQETSVWELWPSQVNAGNHPLHLPGAGPVLDPDCHAFWTAGSSKLLNSRDTCAMVVASF